MSTIGIIGAKGSGKTNIIAGLCLDHEDWPEFFVIPRSPKEVGDTVLEKMKHSNWRSSVNFKILQWRTMDKVLDEAKADLNKRPLKWPEPTDASNTYDHTVLTEARDLLNDNASRNAHTINMVDMPGSHFDPAFLDPKYIPESQLQTNRQSWLETRKRLEPCEALIICLDSMTPFKNEQDFTRIRRTLEEIIRVTQDVCIRAKSRGNTEKLFPVTVVFTKFDEILSGYSYSDRASGQMIKVDPRAAYEALFKDLFWSLFQRITGDCW